MATRRVTVLVVAALGVAALAGCGSKASNAPANSGGGTRATTTTTPVPSSRGGGHGY